jgi:hypothetical protein
MSSISIKAVLIAGLFDVVISLVVGTIVVLMSAALSGGETADDLARFVDSTSARVLSFVIGSAVSVIAGYMAATIARRGELINGALSSVFCVAAGIYAELAGLSSTPVALSIGGLLLSPLLGALGGYVRLRQLARPA